MAKRPTTSANSPPTNQLLAALPLDDYARIAPSLDIIPMKLRQTLHKAGEPVEYVYFPGWARRSESRPNAARKVDHLRA
jgi:hypothetical protein